MKIFVNSHKHCHKHSATRVTLLHVWGNHSSLCQKHRTIRTVHDTGMKYQYMSLCYRHKLSTVHSGTGINPWAKFTLSHLNIFHSHCPLHSAADMRQSKQVILLQCPSQIMSQLSTSPSACITSDLHLWLSTDHSAIYIHAYIKKYISQWLCPYQSSFHGYQCYHFNVCFAQNVWRSPWISHTTCRLVPQHTWKGLSQLAITGMICLMLPVMA